MALMTMWQVVGLPDGPGSTPAPYTPSPGMLAYVVRHALHCATAAPGTRSFTSPFDQWIETDSPSCVVARNHQDDFFLMPTLEFYGVFGMPATPQNGTLEDFVRYSEELGGPHRSEFGDEVNVGALDAIDCSGLPVIFQRYKDEYYAIFRDQVPFTPARFLAGLNSWNRDIIDGMYNLFESTPLDHPVHRLERWWIHASMMAGQKAVKKELGWI